MFGCSFAIIRLIMTSVSQRRRCAPSPLVGRDERSSLLEGWGEGSRSIDSPQPPHPDRIWRCDIAEAPLRRSFLRTAAEGGLCSPTRGEVAPSGWRQITQLSGSNSRDDNGAATPAELRILRQGPAAECNGSANLLLRMHVLCGLRGDQARQRLSELRRRVCATTDPARDRTAARSVRREAPAVGQAGTPQIQSRRYRGAFGEASRYSAGGALNCPTVIARSTCDEAIQLLSWRGRKMDCFAEPVIGRAFARPVGSQ
jgi:hypothetical protein